MFILILFAFIGGLVTVLSPCILPILPIVLSGSVTGGKRRPFGVVTGFILSFTFFTLFLSAIVKATGVSADFLRTISVVIIGVFGASLLIPQFQVMMETVFSRLSSAVSTKQQGLQQRSDFIGGVLIGLSLGLIWTPCVGPILAAIITLAATSTVTSTALFITLSYALGTALPLLAITYGGRELLNKHPWLLANTASIQKGFGIIMIITAIGIHFNVDRVFQSYILEAFPQYGVGLTALEDNELVQNQLNRLQQHNDASTKNEADTTTENASGKPAPGFEAGGNWFNLPDGTSSLSLEELRGKVVLVDFWTYTCINCIRTLPFLNSWHEKYADQGLVIVGVHTPEFEFEKEPENVREAIADFDIKYPVVQDNDYKIWRSYNNRFWPAKYFVDKNGRIRWMHFGEGKYDESEQMIQKLLKETGVDVRQSDVSAPKEIENYSQTPETYLGYGRIKGFASPEAIRQNQEESYSFPQNPEPNTVSYQGSWTIGDERAMSLTGGQLLLRFEAKNVFLVMRPSNAAESRVRVYLDDIIIPDAIAGKDVVDGLVTVTTDRLYELVRLDDPGSHTLRLEFLDGNIELFAFTFG